MDTNTPNIPNVEPQTPSSNSVLPRVIFFAFIAVVLALFWFFTRPEKAGAPVDEQGASGTSGGNITLVQGAVEYKTADGTWQRAEKDTKVTQGDSVEVVGAGRAIIALPDGSSVRLGDNSSVVLSGISEDIITVTNAKGVVYTRVAKSDRLFDVVVGEKTYEAVGTAYKTINDANLQGVEVYESKVKIMGGNETEVLVEQGNKYYVLNKKNVKLENKLIKITRTDIAKDEFVKWNNTIDAEAIKTETVTPAKATDTSKTPETANQNETTSEIVLSGKATSDGVYLTWTVTDLAVPNGFKIVRSTGINPVYPGNEYIYLSDQAARSYTWKMTDGKSYYFRVCKYIDGKCSNYSNNLLLKAPYQAETVGEVNVTSIYVTASGDTISWRTTGNSPLGFKLVWSKNTHPTYPTRDGDKYNYYTDPEQAAGTVDAFDGAGTYYLRVCEYLGSACGVYSNEIQVTL
jgi:hypothetical protein